MLWGILCQKEYVGSNLIERWKKQLFESHLAFVDFFMAPVTIVVASLIIALLVTSDSISGYTTERLLQWLILVTDMKLKEMTSA